MAYLRVIGWPLNAAAILTASAASAAIEPRSMALGKAVEGSVTRDAPDCYQIDIPKGEKVAVTLAGADFPHALQVMRGARCDADVPQFEAEAGAGRRSVLPFSSVGGRYLVVVRAQSGGGRYKLSVTAREPAAEVATTTTTVETTTVTTPPPGIPPEAMAGLDIPPPPPAKPENPVDPKVALMKKQLLAYNIQKAEEEARAAERRRQEAEQREREEEERQIRAESERQARAEREAASEQMWGAILSGVQQVTQTYVEAKHERYEQQARLNALAAEQQRRAAEQRAETLRQQQAATAQKQTQDREVLARTLAQANATRDQMIAKTTDPKVKAQLEMWNEKARATARQYGIEGQMRQQSMQVTGQVVPGATAQQVAQQAQADRQAEAAKREESARLQRETQAKREADALKAQQDAEKRQEDMRKAQELQRKQQEEARTRMQAQAWMSQRASGGMSTVGLGAIDKNGRPPGSGELSRGVNHIGGCKATNISVRYNLGLLMGESVVNGSWSWEGDPACTPPHNTAIWLRLQNGSAYGYVRIAPAVPNAGRGFGYNSPESGPWGRTVCAFSGSGPTNCMNEQQAKALWVSGQVVGFEVGW